MIRAGGFLVLLALIAGSGLFGGLGAIEFTGVLVLLAAGAILLVTGLVTRSRSGTSSP